MDLMITLSKNIKIIAKVRENDLTKFRTLLRFTIVPFYKIDLTLPFEKLRTINGRICLGLIAAKKNLCSSVTPAERVFKIRTEGI